MHGGVRASTRDGGGGGVLAVTRPPLRRWPSNRLQGSRRRLKGTSTAAMEEQGKDCGVGRLRQRRSSTSRGRTAAQELEQGRGAMALQQQGTAVVNSTSDKRLKRTAPQKVQAIALPRFPIKGHIAKSCSGLHIHQASSAAAPGANPRHRLPPPYLPRLVHQETEAYHGVVRFPS
ncbi:hypothetical protein SESBI_46771 [Sesbania bispinosa]|nr:hypothetical protein SESBI_46771 [Sesbania bispinosa]